MTTYTYKMWILRINDNDDDAIMMMMMIIIIDGCELIAIPFKFLNRTGNYLGKENLKYDNKLIQNLSESFTASKIIFGYSLQKNILDKILINLRKSIYFAKKSALISTLLVYFFQPIGILGASIAFIMFYNDKSQLSALAAIFWSLVSGIPIISNLLRGNFQILNLEPNIEQYNNLINETKKIEKSNSGQLINTFNKKINFKNVSFEYITNNSILENINLSKQSTKNFQERLLIVIIWFDYLSLKNHH